MQKVYLNDFYAVLKIRSYFMTTDIQASQIYIIIAQIWENNLAEQDRNASANTHREKHTYADMYVHVDSHISNSYIFALNLKWNHKQCFIAHNDFMTFLQ